jgi:primosomal protein N' (replication factor Y)
VTAVTDPSLFPTPASPTPGARHAFTRFATVAPERALDIAGDLTYAVPNDMRDLTPGERVLVPLRGERAAPGLVLAVTDEPPAIDPARLRPIARRTGLRLPEPLVELARWIGRYYCCPVGAVAASMLPAAVKSGVGERRRTVLERSGAEPARSLPKATQSAWLALLAADPDPLPTDKKSLAHALNLPSTAPITRLVSLGLLRERSERIIRVPGGRDVGADHAPSPAAAAPPSLTQAQRDAVEGIAARLGGFAGVLLLGVTGSGKTEVYLHAIERVLAAGRGAIVLVPEISLTPQTVGRFVARFGSDRVAVLHSGLTKAQRHAEWARVREGRAGVVVGARSAVFAPFDQATPLGLIVVDEEHDGSFKQDAAPRYHARDVALKRGQLEHCPVVLGSATPSLESFYNAQLGHFHRIDLPQRVGGGALPRVRIVDLLAERRHASEQRESLSALGPTLRGGIARTLESGAQVMLLLNRRGYASYIACRHAACSFRLSCDDCDAAMVHHRERLPGADEPEPRRVVRCHHCLAAKLLPERCPACGGRLALLGFGTQRLEDDLRRAFPDLAAGETMLRLDSDTMRRAADYAAALDRFRRGDARLLLGTQMIAKGLDFPNVALIGVVNADTALHVPDFRAGERTFQLVAQVAGRAGRSAGSARTSQVIVQTAEPLSPAIQAAAAHDYERFAHAELRIRARAGLPPAGRMARLLYRDEHIERAERRAHEAARVLRAFAQEHPGANVQWKGPMPAPIARIAGQWRISLEVLAGSAGELQQVLTSLRNAGLVTADPHATVDVDPVSLT